jgi:hypothetical protein
VLRLGTAALRPLIAATVGSGALLYARCDNPPPTLPPQLAVVPAAPASDKDATESLPSSSVVSANELAASIVGDTASLLGKSATALRTRLRLYFSMLSGGKPEFPVSKLKNDVVVFALSGGLKVDLATVFDRDGSGSVSFAEFVYGMCIIQLLFHLEHSPEVEHRLGELMVRMAAVGALRALPR